MLFAESCTAPHSHPKEPDSRSQKGTLAIKKRELQSMAGNSLIKASRSARCTESQTPSLQPLCLSCHSNFTQVVAGTEFNTQHISSSSVAPRQGDQQWEQPWGWGQAGSSWRWCHGGLEAPWVLRQACGPWQQDASSQCPAVSKQHTDPRGFQARNECFEDNYGRLANSVCLFVCVTWLQPDLLGQTAPAVTAEQ